MRMMDTARIVSTSYARIDVFSDEDGVVYTVVYTVVYI
jgi:hypothetical protein